MRKILLAIPSDSSFYKPSLLTFQQLDWDVRNIDYRKTDFIAAVKNYLRLPKRVIRELETQNRLSIKRVINNSEILRVAKLWKPDLFLTFKGEIILPETIKALKALGIVTVCWYPDHFDDNKENSAVIEAYDCFVYWDKWRTNQYHKKGQNNVFYLPFATIPEKTPAPKQKEYLINFVANWQAHREDKIFPVRDLGLMIWGGKQWQISRLSDHYQGGPVSVAEMIKIMRASKITLNVHVVEKIYSEGTNVRTFEAPGAGAFLLVNKRASLYELYGVGKEIEVFNSKEELVEKTKFYLKNDKAREKIALAGWKRTRRDHTYSNRFRDLLKHIYK